MRAVVIEPDRDGGSAYFCEVEPTLACLQGMVGGDIEVVGLAACRFDVSAYINENGKLLGSPVNSKATNATNLQVPGDYIAGRMVVLGAPDAEGFDTPVDSEFLNWLVDHLAYVEYLRRRVRRLLAPGQGGVVASMGHAELMDVLVRAGAAA